MVIPETAEYTLDYIAVEKDADCRSVIQRVFNQVRLARPGLFARKDIFRYGDDVAALAHRRKLPPFTCSSQVCLASRSRAQTQMQVNLRWAFTMIENSLQLWENFTDDYDRQTL
eukprot:jgi/Pico_ML_1/53031/g3653.t1